MLVPYDNYLPLTLGPDEDRVMDVEQTATILPLYFPILTLRGIDPTNSVQVIIESILNPGPTAPAAYRGDARTILLNTTLTGLDFLRFEFPVNVLSGAIVKHRVTLSNLSLASSAYVHWYVNAAYEATAISPNPTLVLP